MPRKIIYYNGPATTTHSLAMSLANAFSRAATPVHGHGRHSPLCADDLDPRKTVLFILPGITGEHSPYHRDLPPAFMRDLQAHVKNGLNILAFCAGAAHLSRDVRYEAPWGTSKSRRNIVPLFEGLAHGPLWNYASRYDRHDRYSDVATAPLRITEATGQPERVYMPYGNGPAFYPDAKIYSNTDYTVHARFDDVPDRPPAILEIRYGRGRVVLCGAHPEITCHEMQKNKTLYSDTQAQSNIRTLLPCQDKNTRFFNRLVHSLAGTEQQTGNPGLKMLHLRA